MVERPLYAVVDYEAKVGDSTFAVPFPYIDKAHVFVYVDDYPENYTWLSDNSIKLNNPLLQDATVRVRRQTPLDRRLVDFQSASVLTEKDLDVSALQVFFNQQEVEDDLYLGLLGYDVSNLKGDRGDYPEQRFQWAINAPATPTPFDPQPFGWLPAIPEEPENEDPEVTYHLWLTQCWKSGVNGECLTVWSKPVRLTGNDAERLDLKDGWIRREHFEAELAAQIELDRTALDEATGLAVAARDEAQLAAQNAAAAQASAETAQQTTEQAINDANQALTDAQSLKDDALSAADYAEQQAGLADQARGAAVTASTDAEGYAQAALVSKNTAADHESGSFANSQAAATAATNADGSAQAALTAKTDAVNAKDEAVLAADAAVVAKTDAEGNASAALAASTEAKTYRDQSKTNADAAVLAKTDAEGAAQAALVAKTDTETLAGQAQTSAQAAATAKTDAEGAATAALTAKSDALDAAGNAETSASAAASAATDAEGHAQAALTAKTTAEGEAGNAATSAQAAALAKTNAEGHAQAALTAKTNAESAADAAVLAKTDAEGSATSALTARTQAESARDAAATSETNAANSAAAASTDAQAAVQARTDAEGYASSALVAKTDAESAASDANTSAVAAAQAKTDAEGNASASLVAQTAAESARDDAQAAANTATTQATAAVSAKTDAEGAAQVALTAQSEAQNAATNATNQANVAIQAAADANEGAELVTQVSLVQGIIMDEWEGSTSVQEASDAASAIFKQTLTADMEGKAALRVQLTDAEGGIRIAWNGVEFPDEIRGNNNETKWYEFVVDASLGDNEVAIWRETADGATIRKIELRGGDQSEKFTAVEERLRATEDEAFFSLKVQYDGKVAGIGAIADPLGTALLFQADQIGFTHDAGDEIFPFTIRDGIVYMDKARMVTLEANSIVNVESIYNTEKRALLGNTNIEGSFVLQMPEQIMWKDLNSEFRDRLVLRSKDATITGGTYTAVDQVVVNNLTYAAKQGSSTNPPIESGGKYTEVKILVTGGTGFGNPSQTQLYAPELGYSVYRKNLTTGTTETVGSRSIIGTVGYDDTSPPTWHTNMYSQEVLTPALPTNGDNYEYWVKVNSKDGDWGVTGGQITIEVNEEVGSSDSLVVNTEWGLILDKPDTATRWPTWNEVSGKPITPAVNYTVTRTFLQDSATLNSGFYTTSQGLPNPDNSGTEESSWWHVLHFKHGQENGYAAQLALELSSGTDAKLQFRTSGGNSNGDNWTNWYKVYSEQHKPTWDEVTNKPTVAILNAHQSYWGLPAGSDGSPDGYIRTPTSGIIPYKSGGASSLGTSGWPFINLNVNNIFNYSTASLGRTTINSSGTIAGSSFDNGWLKIGDSANGWAFAPNEIYATSNGIIGSLSGHLSLQPKDGNVRMLGCTLNLSGNLKLYARASDVLHVQNSNGWVRVGANNTEWAHFYTDRGKFYMDNELHVDGMIKVYNRMSQLTADGNHLLVGASSSYFTRLTNNGDIARKNSGWANNSGEQKILRNDWVGNIGDFIQLQPSGNRNTNGSLLVGTNGFAVGLHGQDKPSADVRVPFTDTWMSADTTDFWLSGKRVIRHSDSWLRLNEDESFSSGIYCGGSTVRTDGNLQVGSSGDAFNANTGQIDLKVTTRVHNKLHAREIVSQDGNFTTIGAGELGNSLRQHVIDTHGTGNEGLHLGGEHGVYLYSHPDNMTGGMAASYSIRPIASDGATYINHLDVYKDQNNASQIVARFRHPNQNTNVAIVAKNQDKGSFCLEANADAGDLRIQTADTSGQYSSGSGDAGSIARFHRNGDVDIAREVTAQDFIATSDRRVKENLEEITGALDKVGSLTGFTYDQTELNQRKAGVIAQDVQEVLPEAVSEDSEGKLSVSPMALVGLLTNAVKELKDQLNDALTEIKELKQTVYG